MFGLKMGRKFRESSSLGVDFKRRSKRDEGTVKD